MTDPARENDQNGPAIRRDLPPAAEAMARRRIAAAGGRAQAALLWERVWPLIVPILCTVGVFLILSWLGIWTALPELARFGLLGLFGTILLFLALRFRHVAWPGPDEALARVARQSGEAHRPAVAFDDPLSHPTEDELTLALWRAHRLRLLERLQQLKAGWPAPGMNRRDPYALRFLVPLLLLVTFIAAGPDRGGRLADAVRPTTIMAEAAPRIDAWVTPPAYTGHPPIFLTGDVNRPVAAESERAITVPQGSTVTIRMPDTADLGVTALTKDGRPVPLDVAPADKAGPTGAPAERRLTLVGDSTVRIDRNGTTMMGWSFAVTPDEPPKISPTREPGATASGSLSLAYSVSDDYGVVSAKGLIVNADPTTGDGARPLVEAPELPLNLPRLRMREGTGETIRDLSAHPWAGAKVRMTLVATDEMNQTGESAPIEFVLPARRFNNPLARAVVEQRRTLALDANKAGYVAMALDAITVDPSKFQQDGVYLSLRAAYHRLTGARDDADLVSVVDFLWEIALGIEDGDLSLAAQDLRQAQEALRKAIENNASDAELEKAMQDLRAAMDKYLQALAEQAQKNPQANQQAANPNAQMLRPEDLQKMLDQIENLAKTGSKEAAQQMLSELQQMMENLEAGRSQQAQQQQGQQGEMNQALDKLGEMIRRQQELMDKTFKMDPDTDGSGAEQQPMTPQERQQALDALRKGQQDLAQALQDLQKQMEGQGMKPDGKLGQAGRSMGEATDQLGQGQPGQAVGPQGEALQALRDGARSLAEQMARQNGTGTQPGTGTARGQGQDPLGRRQQSRGTDLGSSVKVPDAIDTQRAREILDAIRKRLGDAARPLIERDYLERLLEPY
ncbi:TIGR02302 family protein [Kaistia dalseonensis]|uniref:Uncharacterized protein (TIGR02302 family) n=1 Tax=Kaistia dalseonensis TaxID=410840 RepID=A0ABU0H4D0_9HYPH|nr:TIGR02302 family protein [Kaistia dalseonensis]MCX5494585.1 TIGR02302 family protein [Kaistia dalseonensis]MDQ0437165.1 uncharacterized protein (TIGR02302 family) [Kaistia dalseonensis]